jgi:hypothetical protein
VDKIFSASIALVTSSRSHAIERGGEKNRGGTVSTVRREWGGYRLRWMTNLRGSVSERRREGSRKKRQSEGVCERDRDREREGEEEVKIQTSLRLCFELNLIHFQELCSFIDFGSAVVLSLYLFKISLQRLLSEPTMVTNMRSTRSEEEQEQEEQ